MAKKSVNTPKNPPVVWVTGASRGIGRAIAKAFANINAEVVVTSRNGPRLEKLAREIRKGGGRATPLICDVASERNVKSTAEKIFSRFGRVDVLVNNAGVTHFNSLRQTTLREFDGVIATNLRGTFLCTKAVLESMIRRRSGHIFNIVSIAAQNIFTESGAYSASKAGVLAFTNVLREEIRQYKIKVTAVLPGPTETLMWSSSTRRKYRHRMMQPDDVAALILAIYQQPRRAHTEEIIVRPQLGNLP